MTSEIPESALAARAALARAYDALEVADVALTVLRALCEDRLTPEQARSFELAHDQVRELSPGRKGGL